MQCVTVDADSFASLAHVGQISLYRCSFLAHTFLLLTFGCVIGTVRFFTQFINIASSQRQRDDQAARSQLRRKHWAGSVGGVIAQSKRREREPRASVRERDDSYNFYLLSPYRIVDFDGMKSCCQPGRLSVILRTNMNSWSWQFYFSSCFVFFTETEHSEY